LSRNPFYTVLGLGLLAAQCLKPRIEVNRVEQQHRHEQPSIEFLRVKSSQRAASNAAEKVVLSLYTGVIVALVAIWSSAMTNSYASEAKVRCGAAAMGYFAAAGIEVVMAQAIIFWGLSIVWRWCARVMSPRNHLHSWLVWAPVWLWLGWGAFAGIKLISTDTMWIAHVPPNFPSEVEPSRCHNLLISDQDGSLIFRLLWPSGDLFSGAEQPKK
jgi:hypothetical protein